MYVHLCLFTTHYLYTIVCLPFPVAMKRTAEPGILRRTRLPLSKSPRLFHLSLWREIQITPAARLLIPPIISKKLRKNHHLRRIVFPIFSTDLKSKDILRVQLLSVKHLSRNPSQVQKDPHLIDQIL